MSLKATFSIHCCLFIAAHLAILTAKANENYPSQPLAEVGYYPSYQLNAKVIALTQSSLAAKINGHVIDVLVAEGDRVQADQVLAKLDCFNHENALEIAKIQLQKTQASIDLLQKQLQREQRLHQNNNLSQAQIDTRENALISATIDKQQQQSLIAQRQYTVDQCAIKAPFAGVIIKKMVEKGQTASPSAALFNLLSLDNNQISVMVPQTLVSNLRAASKSQFIVNNQAFDIRFQQAFPVVQSNRTQELRFSFDKAALIAGTQGLLSWQDANIYLPPQIIKRYHDHLGIFVLQAGNPVFKKLPKAQESRAAQVDLPLDTLIISDFNDLSKQVEIVD